MNDPEKGWIVHGKSDRGELILGNLTDDILLWSKTSFRYYKRQSQDDPDTDDPNTDDPNTEDPDTWVWIKDDRLDLPTSAIRAP